MRWSKFSSSNARQQLMALARTLKNRECCIAYSPSPANATVTVTLFLDWKTRAMRKSSIAGNRDVMRFYGVSGIKITTQDTITVGDFKKLEYNRIGDRAVCRIVLEAMDAQTNEVQFTFSGCELNLGGQRKIETKQPNKKAGPQKR